MQRNYELKHLVLGAMKRVLQYLLLIVMITSCQTKYECTSIGCQVVEKTKPKTSKKSFFKKNIKNKLRKKPKKGLFKRGILPKFDNAN